MDTKALKTRVVEMATYFYIQSEGVRSFTKSAPRKGLMQWLYGDRRVTATEVTWRTWYDKELPWRTWYDKELPAINGLPQILKFKTLEDATAYAKDAEAKANFKPIYHYL